MTEWIGPVGRNLNVGTVVAIVLVPVLLYIFLRFIGEPTLPILAWLTAPYVVVMALVNLGMRRQYGPVWNCLWTPVPGPEVSGRVAKALFEAGEGFTRRGEETTLWDHKLAETLVLESGMRVAFSGSGPSVAYVGPVGEFNAVEVGRLKALVEAALEEGETPEVR